MRLSGVFRGAKLLRFVNFPVPVILEPDASEPGSRRCARSGRSRSARPILTPTSTVRRLVNMTALTAVDANSHRQA